MGIKAWFASVYARVITAGKEDKHEYCCLMMAFDDDLKARILEWNFHKIHEADLYIEEGHGRELKPHVTLKYGLLDDNPEVFFPEIPDKPIKFELGPVSRFDTNPDYDVLKIEVVSPELSALHEKISSKFKNEDSHPEYKPHLTLAYVKKGAAKQLDGNQDFFNMEGQFVTVLFTNHNNDEFKKHLDEKTASWNFPLTSDDKPVYYIRAGMSEVAEQISKAGSTYAMEWFAQHKSQLSVIVAETHDADEANAKLGNYVENNVNFDPVRDKIKVADEVPGIWATYVEGFTVTLEKLIGDEIWPFH